MLLLTIDFPTQNHETKNYFIICKSYKEMMFCFALFCLVLLCFALLCFSLLMRRQIIKIIVKNHMNNKTSCHWYSNQFYHITITDDINFEGFFMLAYIIYLFIIIFITTSYTFQLIFHMCFFPFKFANLELRYNEMKNF